MPILRPGENIILQESKRNIIEKFGHGTLYLTNFRLILEGTTGIVSKRLRVAFDLRLDMITDISVEGLVSKRLMLFATGGQYKLHVDDTSMWEEAIRTAIARFRPLELVSWTSAAAPQPQAGPLVAQLLAPHALVLPTICRNTRDIIVRSVSVISNHENGF